jgi:hypothetical protein
MTSTLDPTPDVTRPSRRRWWPVVVALLLSPVLAIGAWLVFVVVGFAGGLDSLFAGSAPSPDDPEVVAARTAAAEEVGADVDRLTEAVLLPSLGPGARTLGTDDVAAACQEGQHNWKIDDDFDLRCDLDRVVVAAAPDLAGFESDMRALDVALTDEGWQPAGSFGISSVLDEYWHKRSELWAGYGPADLPSARYYRSGGTGPRSLTVDWLRNASESGIPTDVYRDDVPAVGYVVAMSESVEYFSG